MLQVVLDHMQDGASNGLREVLIPPGDSVGTRKVRSRSFSESREMNRSTCSSTKRSYFSRSWSATGSGPSQGANESPVSGDIRMIQASIPPRSAEGVEQGRERRSAISGELDRGQSRERLEVPRPIGRVVCMPPEHPRYFGHAGPPNRPRNIAVLAAQCEAVRDRPAPRVPGR
jgi:hypothetical protein